jgi:hypothetical protein
VFDESGQIHDFNPGISANGVFWTVRLPDSALSIQFPFGNAQLTAHNLDADDYFNLNNALSVQLGGPALHTPAEVPATVSFQINWHDVVERFKLNLAKAGFRGEYILTNSTTTWSAQAPAAQGAPSFSFHSTSSENAFSVLGRERNGKFFFGPVTV